MSSAFEISEDFGASLSLTESGYPLISQPFTLSQRRALSQVFPLSDGFRATYLVVFSAYYGVKRRKNTIGPRNELA